MIRNIQVNLDAVLIPGENKVKTLEMMKQDGGLMTIETSTLATLQDLIGGDLITASHADYDTARSVWNGMVNKYPSVIACCTSPSDVVECVRFARKNNLLVSVRGGGHNYAGKSIAEQGLVIDLSLMQNIEVNAEAKTVCVSAGCLLGSVDEATAPFGLATTFGIYPGTGAAGLTLGGGYGWLAGRFGLACDNLLEAKVITCDGKSLTASANENPDLFWGIRGAGANLCIATSFTFKLHPVANVVGGMIFFPRSEAKKFLRFFDDYARNAPDELTLLGLLAAPDETPAAGAVVCYSGDVETGKKILAPMREFSTPIMDTIEVMPYVMMQQHLVDLLPAHRHYYNKSHIFKSLSDEAIDVFVEYAQNLPTLVSAIMFQQMHGAAARVLADDTAFPHRFDHYSCYIHPATDDSTEHEHMINWARDCWQAVQPYAESAIYVNALEDGDEEGEQRVREAYGSNFERLRVLKKLYDPTNFLQLNSNIPTG
jgi:FAD/FMN-containing dehydrogenase